ncbi:hypothetical protein P9209_25740 [Prescottella defluvii]|nr:hypothetical protein P9209_25740 [Prescottella defluvii]
MNALEQYRRRLEPNLPRVRDVVVTAATIMLLIVRFVQTGSVSTVAVWATVSSVAAATMLMWRRRYPIAVTGVGIMVCAISGRTS